VLEGSTLYIPFAQILYGWLWLAVLLLRAGGEGRLDIVLAGRFMLSKVSKVCFTAPIIAHGFLFPRAGPASRAAWY
jgi:hypothetical protein